VVVLHDGTLDRTTDRHGLLADLTLAEVQAADAGTWKGAAYRGERIPTLAEVIALVKAEGGGRVRLNLELKYHMDRAIAPPPELEQQAVAVLRAHGFVSNVFVQSFHHAVLPRVKALEPRIPTGTLVTEREFPPDPVALVRRHGADYFAPDHRTVRPGLVGQLHAAGIPVVIWTVNELADMKRLLAMGVGARPGDGIISDHPDRLVGLKDSSR
jgi:glycerophosphoryl diester phosphodiesterase